MARLRCFLAALVFGIVLVSGVAKATSTRILSLGGLSDYFEDDFNILLWYGSLPDYGNLAVLELGDFYFSRDDADPNQVIRQGAGVHANFDRAQKWGTAALYLSDVTDPDQIPGTLNLMWARRFGPIQAGLSFQWTLLDELFLADGDSFRSKESNSKLGLGLRWDLAERVYTDLAADAVGTWRQYEVQEAGIVIYDEEQRNSWDSYNLRGRLFWGVAEKVALVPVFTYQRRDHLTSLTSTNIPADLDAHETHLGLGVDVFPNSDNMLLFSYEYRTGKERFDIRDNPFDLHQLENKFHEHNLRLGLESRVISWLTLRGGALQVIPDMNFKAVYLDSGTEDSVTGGFEDPQLDLNLGIGLHFGAFDADFAFNDNAPFSLGYFLTGGGEGDHNFTSITLQYIF